MALHRGIQSAIFYYLSCAPCAEMKYRKKRKEEARLDRANREALEMEQPDLYRHPSPSSTNPFWEAERMQGPHGRRKKKTNTNLSADSETRLRMPPPASRDGKVCSNAPRSSHSSPLLTSVELSRPNSRLDRCEQDRPRARHQREDEELWGESGAIIPVPSNLSAESLRRPPTARSASSNISHLSNRNAAVNDLHPATTRKIASRNEVAWMLQPPPVAAVMEGKERPNRSRSNSGGSRPSAGSSQPLSRQVSHRIVEGKLRAGQYLAPAMLRADSTPVNPMAKSSSQTHSRKRSLTTGSTQPTSKADSLSARRGARLPPFQLQSTPDLGVQNTSENLSSFLSPKKARDIHSSRRHADSAVYPSLSPVISIGMTPQDENARPLSLRDMRAAWVAETSDLDGSADKPDALAVKKPPLVRGHSLQSLGKGTQEVSKQPKALDPSPTLVEAKIRARPDHHQTSHHFNDDLEDSGIDTDINDMQVPDSWHSPDFDLHTWVTEHTKRDVRHRWSMDI